MSIWIVILTKYSHCILGDCNFGRCGICISFNCCWCCCALLSINRSFLWSSVSNASAVRGQVEARYSHSSWCCPAWKCRPFPWLYSHSAFRLENNVSYATGNTYFVNCHKTIKCFFLMISLKWRDVKIVRLVVRVAPFHNSCNASQSFFYIIRLPVWRNDRLVRNIRDQAIPPSFSRSASSSLTFLRHPPSGRVSLSLWLLATDVSNPFPFQVGRPLPNIRYACLWAQCNVSESICPLYTYNTAFGSYYINISFFLTGSSWLCGN